MLAAHWVREVNIRMPCLQLWVGVKVDAVRLKAVQVERQLGRDGNADGIEVLRNKKAQELAERALPEPTDTESAAFCGISRSSKTLKTCAAYSSCASVQIFIAETNVKIQSFNV